MTVDESPVSPPHHAGAKSKTAQSATTASSTVSTSPQSAPVSEVASSTATRLPQGSPRPAAADSHSGHSGMSLAGGSVQQSQTLHRSNSPSSNTIASRGHNNTPMSAPRSPITFENYVQGNQAKAKQILDQLTEVTGVRDTSVLYKAFNETRKGDQFNVTLAIEWILSLPPQTASLMPDLAPINDTKRNPLTIATRQDVGTSSSSVPMQPPNSPNSNSNISVSSANRNLVDLTENVSSVQGKTGTSVGNTSNEDADLEKAIALSLQEANAQARNIPSSHGPPGMSQEDQDVSRALEASLAEHTGGYGKRRKDGSWADPLNPHDRERNGLWPVGLKNVGQTCWFSAVIQSLFYLPAFRSLVLNYKPPASMAHLSDERRNSDKSPPVESAQYNVIEDSRHKKIVEFMLELRKLFALLVASQRKYVDPTRAVDILRASFGGTANVVESETRASNTNTTVSSNVGSGDQGSGNTGGSSVSNNANENKSAINQSGNIAAQASNVLIMMDNNQQDVSEFTHIVLEWVEEAFKKPNSTLSNAPVMSLDNKEELMEEGSIGNDAQQADGEDEKENNEEKANREEDDEDISEKETNQAPFSPKEDSMCSGTKNPMTELFYGQVLTEGSIQGEEFIRSEAFGQWPLQVNTYKDIHETLENSTAHEYFDQAATGTPSGSATNQVSSILNSPTSAVAPAIPSSGQERWFTKLPPVLVLELSRFHFNTERKAAEKIHNRLEFSEKIYMDRYMDANKNVTRRKRDEVRRLKETRSHLKARLEKFTKYRGSAAHEHADNSNDNLSSSTTTETGSNTFLPLPKILQYALDFANAGDGSLGGNNPLSSAGAGRGCDVSMNSPSNDAHSHSHLSSQAGPVQQLHQQSAMQIDSPCGSPKVTPASSVSNLNSAQDAAKDPAEVPMDVCDENILLNETSAASKGVSKGSIGSSTGTTTSSHIPNLILHGCDSSNSNSALGATSMSPQTAGIGSDISLDQLPCPKHISEQELTILQNCLSRWKEEVTKDILCLQTSITEIDHKIESMYEEDSLKRLEYQLHAVMVHEGGVDSGHYWAYVKDHKKQVWLKFNDNTVNEASWEELLKESVGGRSNTSAYSLVYIDTSKPEILLQVTEDISGEAQEESMEEGALESLAQGLPRDLGEFVLQNNNDFRDECIRWDKEQEERKRLEESQKELAQQQALSGNTGHASTSLDPNNDVLVVQEKLTHVNTHAKLSIEITFKAIKAVENIIRKDGMAIGIQHAMDKTVQFYSKKLDREQNMQNSNSNNGTTAFGSNQQGIPDLPSTDLRLDSFCAYLLKNNEKERVLELCLLEQFSLPGLDAQNDQLASEFRKTSEQSLRQRRSQNPTEAAILKQWHQIYHWYRMSAHCLVSGLDHLCQHQFEESLDMFTEAYNYTVGLYEYQMPSNPINHSTNITRGLRMAHLLRLLCLTLPEVNHCLIKRFRLHENDDKELLEVNKNVRQLIVPVLILLQTRISQASNSMSNTSPQNQGAAQAARTLEDVRSDWCALLGEADASSKAGAAISDILRMVLEPPMDTVGEKASKKRRDMSVEHSADLMLSQRYMDVRQQLHELMQDDTGSEGESGTMNVPAQNATVQPSQTMTSNQPQVPSASSNNGNKVRVRSGGNENGSSGSSGSGPKVVMM